MKKITVIVPCFNEAQTILRVFTSLMDVHFTMGNRDITKEIIFVDDGSTDGTGTQLAHTIATTHTPCVVRHLTHSTNRGKGATIRTALEVASGDYVVMQDADLEYDPRDLQQLIAHVAATDAPVVYGSRSRDIANPHSTRIFRWGNWILTAITNLLFRQHLTDVETCYKMIDARLFKFIALQEQRFGIEIEITAKLARIGVTIPEVSISYRPRSFRDGKKIRMRDGITALLLLVKHRCVDLHYGPIDILIRKWRETQVLRALTASASPSSVLDVGCGRQASLAWCMVRRVHRYVGVDPDVQPLEYRNVHIVRANAEDITARLSGQTFDTIVALAVLEHLDAPFQFLYDCRMLLRPGGRLILTTPTPRARIVLSVLARLHLIDPHEIEEHKTHFHPNELVRMLRSAGFSTVQTKKFLCGYNCRYVAAV